jgi:tripartite-type tricarboxylate transporter receptor subunit TctC
MAPVAIIGIMPYVMVVSPSSPARTVAKFIELAKGDPGRINMASNGIGTLPHLCGELFKMAAGVNFVHVPYRGAAPALTDLIAGQVQVMFADITSSIEYIRGGQLRALAVTTANRVEALPETPAMADFVPGFEATGWNGIAAPGNTPADVIDRLHDAINAALVDPKTRSRLIDLGATVVPRSAADFGKLIAADTEKWGKVIRAADIRPE